eukprot:2528179-Prymnesium_polylepis.1
MQTLCFYELTRQASARVGYLVCHMFPFNVMRHGDTYDIDLLRDGPARELCLCLCLLICPCSKYVRRTMLVSFVSVRHAPLRAVPVGFPCLSLCGTCKCSVFGGLRVLVSDLAESLVHYRCSWS